MDTEHNR
ncbi:hypothetical protein D030_3162A, partial [Vibrio parahaemolyticus AQ3810]